MIPLSEKTVLLGASASSKEEAIRLAAGVLVEAGSIDPAYAESMLGREQVANTYLGGGIAIPHGLPGDRHLIRQTALAVVQVRSGLEWNPGEKVHLVVAIAAASDEHLEILANLTRLLADERRVDALAMTDDPALVVAELTGGAGAGPAAGARDAEEPDVTGWASTDVVLTLPHGLHARPATTLVGLAKGFRSDIRVRAGDRVADARSLASLLGLGAAGGSTLTLLAHGSDEAEALEDLAAAVRHGLGEQEEEEEASALRPRSVAWAPTGPASSVAGVGASPGIAIAPLLLLHRRSRQVARQGGPAGEERVRLTDAIAAAGEELRALHAEVRSRSGANQAAIFLAHEAFLDDPALVARTEQLIVAGSSAAWSWQQAVEGQAREVELVDDPLVAARAVDLRDVGERVLRLLAPAGDGDEAALDLPDHPVILVAQDLTPSDTAAIDPVRVVGFVTVAGGPTSHTAIIARSLGIPAVVAAGAAVLEQREGLLGVLDGTAGMLWTGVGDEDLRGARAAQAGAEQVRAEEQRTRYLPAVTVDGHRVEVAANVNGAADAAAAINAGAEGVGLMRTEFLFLGRSEAPSEDEQYEALAAMVRTLNGLPLVVRTLDVGGDKQVPYLDIGEEDGSFLGLRGIRLCLARPELFLTQLRAIYRASKLGPVSVMFPMVARMEDVDEAMVHAERARTEVGADPIDVGIMVEVPSAAVMAPELARRVQFFSIGTNDLTQYVLAMDRLHPVLAGQADALHPAVLRTVKAVVDAARSAGVWVGVCGGVAGEPDAAVLLAGLGVDELSLSVPAVAGVKARLRATDMAAARRLATRALACSTAAEVRALVRP